MRTPIFYTLIIVIVALAICAFKAKRSDKFIGHSVYTLLLALIPPIAGNLIIIASTTKSVAEIGCYIYFIGMDITMAFLLKYTIDYCNYSWTNKKVIAVTYSLFTIDIVQLLLNPFFRHAFDTRRIIVDGAPYYQLVPYLGQTFHRIVAYGFFFASLILFIVKAVRTSRIYSERYVVILLSIVLGGIWETYYILSGTPIDTSMIGFAVFGFCVFYFSLYYKPKVLVEQMMSEIAAELSEALLFFDGDRNCVWASEPALKLLGSDGTNLDELGPMIAKKFPDIADTTPEWKTHQVIGYGENARYYYLEKHVLIDSRGRFAGTFVTVMDNTESQKKLQRERYNARHDKLTGLYNKDTVFKAIEERLAKDPKGDYQIVFVDVNEFKMVNDVFGKDFGDHVLRTIADWISSEMTENSVYGRLGGDTFGVFQPVDEFDPVSVNDKLSSFVVRKGDKEHHILIHAGIYRIDDPSLDVSIMFDRARMAISTIKRTYSHISYYNESIKEMMLWDQQISAQVDDAIAQRQIVPYLQPIVDTEGRVVGAEALARWNHPEKGFLRPDLFIPIFERNGKIVEVDRYIWRCACELLNEWKREQRHPDLFLSVNISPMDFYFMDLRMEVNNLVKEFGIEPSKLRLEITESIMMNNIEERIEVINGLREDGFILEMDDFGSGYSSLNLLKDLPVDIIKLDMAFLKKSQGNEKARIILDGLIKMVDNLNIVSLTEGVETDKQFRALADMGCKLFQGFYFAKPVPVEEFDKFCSDQSA